MWSGGNVIPVIVLQSRVFNVLKFHGSKTRKGGSDGATLALTLNYFHTLKKQHNPNITNRRHQALVNNPKRKTPQSTTASYSEVKKYKMLCTHPNTNNLRHSVCFSLQTRQIFLLHYYSLAPSQRPHSFRVPAGVKLRLIKPQRRSTFNPES